MDITHYYEEKGAGEPLILLHGNGESGEYFRAQTDAFAARFHVYAVDTRGHGRTPRGTQPFTIRQFARDLLGFFDAHGIDRAHVLGFSDGGNIAMRFAMEHPERVDRLILDGANLETGGVEKRVQIPVELGYRVCRALSAYSERAKRKAEMLGLMVDSPNVPEAELARIQSPTLVLAGTRDLIRREETERIARGIRGAELLFLEGGHAVARENPGAFNAAVLRFLEAKK
ncbi:MAG: alpha/beta hydrolase [Oscillibacter sp.]|nr:alpha/beta hydrolase [Oscillibacter sp.]